MPNDELGLEGLMAATPVESDNDSRGALETLNDNINALVGRMDALAVCMNALLEVVSGFLEGAGQTTGVAAPYSGAATVTATTAPSPVVRVVDDLDDLGSPSEKPPKRRRGRPKKADESAAKQGDFLESLGESGGVGAPTRISLSELPPGLQPVQADAQELGTVDEINFDDLLDGL